VGKGKIVDHHVRQFFAKVCVQGRPKVVSPHNQRVPKDRWLAPVFLLSWKMPCAGWFAKALLGGIVGRTARDVDVVAVKRVSPEFLNRGFEKVGGCW